MAYNLLDAVTMSSSFLYLLLFKYLASPTPFVVYLILWCACTSIRKALLDTNWSLIDLYHLLCLYATDPFILRRRGIHGFGGHPYPDNENETTTVFLQYQTSKQDPALKIRP